MAQGEEKIASAGIKWSKISIVINQGINNERDRWVEKVSRAETAIESLLGNDARISKPRVYIYLYICIYKVWSAKRSTDINVPRPEDRLYILCLYLRMLNRPPQYLLC